MACGYSNNSVELSSSLFCRLECKRWHHLHLRKDSEYKKITSEDYNSVSKMFNFKFPQDLEVNQSINILSRVYYLKAKSRAVIRSGNPGVLVVIRWA